MNEFSKNQLIKFEYFGGMENLIGLYKSYRKFIREELYMFNVDTNILERSTDITIDGTSLAVIITAIKVDEVGYFDVIIDEQRYLVKLQNDELDELLKGVMKQEDDPNEALTIYFGQPYFMSIENGFAKNMKIIDYDKYKEALELIPEFIQNNKEVQ